jgi:hypothetical protein
MNRRTEQPDYSNPPERLSQTGQLVGWAVFGGLVLVGFCFGIVTGYEAPKPVLVAKANREKEPPKPSEKPTPKNISPEPQPTPQVMPKEELAPKVEPKKADPPKIEQPKVEPKKIDTPPPPKVEPKKEDLKPVVFKDVLPILRTHCLNCHGAGTGKPKGNVDLTSVAKMMKSRGKILVPGKPNDSDIYTSVTEREMPDGGRPKPKPEEMMLIKRWIETGAKERRRPLRPRRIKSRPGPG